MTSSGLNIPFSITDDDPLPANVPDPDTGYMVTGWKPAYMDVVFDTGAVSEPSGARLALAQGEQLARRQMLAFVYDKGGPLLDSPGAWQIRSTFSSRRGRAASIPDSRVAFVQAIVELLRTRGFGLLQRAK